MKRKYGDPGMVKTGGPPKTVIVDLLNLREQDFGDLIHPEEWHKYQTAKTDSERATIVLSNWYSIHCYLRHENDPYEIVKECLRSGADITVNDARGNSLLYWLDPDESESEWEKNIYVLLKDNGAKE